MHRQLYKNIESHSDKDAYGSELRCYSSWVYFTLLNNDNKFDNDEQEHLKKSIYEQSYVKLFYGSNTNKYITDILLSELCNLHRLLIDEGDGEVIKKHFFKNYRYLRNSTQRDILLMVTLIYLYYLSYREKLLKDKDMQKNAKIILGENESIIKYFYHRMDLIDIVKNHYKYIFDILRKWEYMNCGEAKCIVMDSVILDFLVFTAIDKYWNPSDVSKVIEYLVPDSMFTLYNRYFSDKESPYLKKMLKEYNEVFSKDEERFMTERIAVLRDVCNEHYKRETIKFGDEHRITDEKKRKFTEDVTQRIGDFINTELYDFSFDTDSEELVQLKEKELIYVCVLSDYFFTPEGVDEHILEDITRSIVEAYLRVLIKHKYIKYEKLGFDNKEKQKHLIELTETLDINPDVTIGARDVFWGEEDKEMLSKYTSSMRKVKFPGGYNFYFILDSTKIEISLENIKVEYEDLTWEQIENRCKMTEDGQITYNVTNDLYVPFEKDELLKHITNTKKKVLVYADIKYRISGEKVGTGIKF